MSPAIGGDTGAPPGAIDAMGAGGGAPAAAGAPGGAAAGADQQRAQLQSFMGKLRELDTQITQVFTGMPALQPVAQQMKQLLKKAVQDAAKTAPPQTASSEAVPTSSQ